MTIKELQIEDWVCTEHGFPMQVVGAFKDVAYLDFEGNESDMWEENEKDIYPIPITKETLEKNGFKLHTIPSDGIHSKEVFYLYENDTKKISIKISSLGNEWEVYMQKFEGVYERANTHSGYIQSIHQLQHIIRDCEIEKEIEL